VGTIITCCSITAICHYRSWTEWVNFVLGCWTVISPYALGFEALPSATLVHIALGICIAANAAIQLICELGTKISEQPQNEPFGRKETGRQPGDWFSSNMTGSGTIVGCAVPCVWSCCNVLTAIARH